MSERRLSWILSLLVIVITAIYAGASIAKQQRDIRLDIERRGQALARGIAAIESVSILDNLFLLQRAIVSKHGIDDVTGIVALDPDHMIVASSDPDLIGTTVANGSIVRALEDKTEATLDGDALGKAETLVVIEPLFKELDNRTGRPAEAASSGVQHERELIGWITVELSLNSAKRAALWLLLKELGFVGMLLLVVLPVIHRAVRRLNRDLNAAETKFHHIVDSAPDAIVVADRRGDIRSWNAAAARMFGYQDCEVLGQSLTIVIPARYHQDHRVRFQQAIEAIDPRLTGRMLEYTGLRRDGAEFPVECSVAVWGSGEERYVCGVLRDVTDRTRGERRMRGAHAVARMLAESASIETAMGEILKTMCGTFEWDLGIFWQIDRQANVLRFGESWSASDMEPFLTASRNNTFARGMGLPGRVWKENAPQVVTNVQTDGNFPCAPFAEQVGLAGAIGFPIVAGKAVVGVLEFYSCLVRPPDEELLSTMGAVGRQIGLFLDRARIEEQFHQAQKLNAVGKLAGGIAHDFNNLLTVISGFAELVLYHRPIDEFTATNVEEVKKAAQRAAALTRQLLAFSRRQILEVKVIDINGLVANMESMLRRLIREHIQLVTVLRADAGRIRVDTGQLEQVIVNLVVNARDAMEAGGTLTVETANVELDEEYALQHEEIVPGSYVRLAVSDTGHGMTPELQARIFEPFFTTKPAGKGTGLGLATVYGIVAQSKGSISLHSEPGRGTTFKIYLPRVVEKEVQEQLVPKTGSTSGAETILLVEDEEGVRSLASQILAMGGYTGLTAENGEAALELCARHAGPIHLLVTDMVMPGMSGHQLAVRLKAIRPEVKVLYTSGYIEEGIIPHGEVDAGTPFLQKPFTPDALRRKVREVLDLKDGEVPLQA